MAQRHTWHDMAIQASLIDATAALLKHLFDLKKKKNI